VFVNLVEQYEISSAWLPVLGLKYWNVGEPGEEQCALYICISIYSVFSNYVTLTGLTVFFNEI
jgi:hypothetical protein